MQICLYTEVLGKATTDPDVQTSVKCVLELCSEISQDPVILVWPLLSASANAVGKEDRQWAKDLFRTFRGDHCQDLVIAVCLSSDRVKTVLMTRKSCWTNSGGEWTGAAS
jgi:hypothetical protein